MGAVAISTCPPPRGVIDCRRDQERLDKGTSEPTARSVALLGRRSGERPRGTRNRAIGPDDVEVARVRAADALERERACSGVREDSRYLRVCGQAGRDGLELRDVVSKLLRRRRRGEDEVTLRCAARIAVRLLGPCRSRRRPSRLRRGRKGVQSRPGETRPVLNGPCSWYRHPRGGNKPLARSVWRG